MFGADAAENLYFATHCKTANSGLEDQIRSFMREHPNTGLIIIDTLKRVREVGGADFSYSSDYDIVAEDCCRQLQGDNGNCSPHPQVGSR